MYLYVSFKTNSHLAKTFFKKSHNKLEKKITREKYNFRLEKAFKCFKYKRLKIFKMEIFLYIKISSKGKKQN